MKKIVLLTICLTMLSYTFIGAMAESIQTKAKKLLPGEANQLDAMKGFQNYYEPAWFNKWVVGASKRIRNAKAYLNYITILLDTVDPNATIADLPTTTSGVDLQAQTKAVLTTWGLSLEKLKTPLGGENWFIQPAPPATLADAITQAGQAAQAVNAAARAYTGGDATNIKTEIKNKISTPLIAGI